MGMVIRFVAVVWALSWTMHLVKHAPLHARSVDGSLDTAGVVGVLAGYFACGLGPATLVYCLTLVAD